MVARRSNKFTNPSRTGKHDKKDQKDDKKDDKTTPSTPSGNYLPTPKSEPKMVANEEMTSTSHQQNDMSPFQRVVADEEKASTPRQQNDTPRSQRIVVNEEMASTSYQQNDIPPLQQQEAANGDAVDREQGRSPTKVKPTEEMIKAAEVIVTMKANVAELSKVLETIGSQAALLTSLHESMKIREEVNMVRRDLQRQIEKQTVEIQVKRYHLEDLIKGSLIESVREKLNAQIQDTVQVEVSKKITEELGKQIPEEIKIQASHHLVRMRQIDIDLHNADAKRHNADVKKTEVLRPLLIPRAITISRSSSSGSSMDPTPSATLQTPHDPDSLLLSGASPIISDDLPLRSPLFPVSVQQLYKMDRDRLQQLLQDFGEDAPLAVDYSQYAEQLNKVIYLIGASKYQVVIPPAVSGGRLRLTPPRQPAAQNVPDALLSPLRLATFAPL
ncbi:hypothetical protein AX15_006784 [Amanita polypyramis BW_CC]|nr:hypothetical protein AX15_006784 [Amanita polypyramis BW_CC]